MMLTPRLSRPFLELCRSLDDTAERLEAASEETRKAVEQLSDDLGKHLKPEAWVVR